MLKILYADKFEYVFLNSNATNKNYQHCKITKNAEEKSQNIADGSQHQLATLTDCSFTKPNSVVIIYLSQNFLLFV